MSQGQPGTRVQVTVTDTTLFHVAATWLGDATQWDRIAALNSRTDPLVIGIVVLALPLPVGAVTSASQQP